ncbi:MAG: hypothetical protein QGF36_03380 [Candidatus Marinimicrobia bacterium]|nr:hypothetical protein [Candidatus Neomarinimicrobiota bacterium]
MAGRITQLISIIFCSILFAEGSYEVLMIPKNGRTLALSNSGAASNSVFLSSNPASLQFNEEQYLISLSRIPSGMYFQSLQSSRRLLKGVATGRISLIHYGKLIDSRTEKTSTAFDLMVETAWKTEIKEIVSAGFTLGYLNSVLADYSSQVIFADVGFRSRLFRKRLGVGISVENFGSVLQPYTNYREPLPFLVRIAGYYKPVYFPAVILLDWTKIMDHGNTHLAGGLEFTPRGKVTLRLGLSSHRNNFTTGDFYSDLTMGFSGGIGLELKRMNLDIGVLNLGPAGYMAGITIMRKMD